MTSFFYGLGGLVTLIGLGWCLLVAGQATDSTGYAVLAKVIAMTPGFGVTGSGLIFLAIGGVLHRLDKIIANSATIQR
jgi:hypothetical protein